MSNVQITNKNGEKGGTEAEIERILKEIDSEKGDQDDGDENSSRDSESKRADNPLSDPDDGEETESLEDGSGDSEDETGSSPEDKRRESEQNRNGDKSNNQVDKKLDWEDRYNNSNREYMILQEKNRKLTQTVKDAASITTVTDAELKDYAEKEGATWSDMSTFEKTMAKNALIADRRFAAISNTLADADKIDEWSGKVDSFLDSKDATQDFPQLNGRENEFKKFAMRESNRGVSLDVLVNAFLYTVKPAKKGGSLFNTSTPGDAPKKKQLDENDAEFLRKNKPREWSRLIREGKIKIDI